MARFIDTTRLRRRQVLGGLAGGAAALFTPAILRAQQAHTVRLAYGSTGYTWAVPYVAEEAGLWSEQGVELQTSTFESGRDAMQALLTGGADFSASTDTPFIFAALSGLRPVAVVNYSRYSRDMKIAIHSESGIDPNDPASLKGRSIGTPVGTSGQYLLAKYLQLAGLQPEDITVVNITPGNLAASLARRDIDGFSWTTQAAAVANQQTDGKVEVMTLEGIEDYFQSHQLLLSTERVIEERPEIVEAAVKTLLAAENIIQTDPDWTSIISERIRTPADQIAEAASSYTFRVGFDDRFLEDIEAQAEWAISAGLGTRPDGDLRALLRGLVAEGPTRSVAPDRVTLA